MRGRVDNQVSMMCLINPEDVVPDRHPLRKIKQLAGTGGGSTGSRSNRWVNFRGKKRCNDTHESKTDPDARLMRKGYGKEAKLSYSGHILMENRNGLIVDLASRRRPATERDAAIDMLDHLGGTMRVTIAADRGCDTQDFSARCRAIRVTPHVAQNTSRRSSIDERTTRHDGNKWSQRIRKRIEEAFGWAKTIGGMRRTRFRGIPRISLAATLTFTALNILRIANLSPPSTA